MPENSVKSLKMSIIAILFKMQTMQTDNGIEFIYKYVSEDKIFPVDKALEFFKIEHKLIPASTPRHNGKLERNHRNDQRYFYNWETFRSIDELNEKRREHL